MHYSDLRDFTAQLERLGELRRVTAEVSPRLEMTEICDRVLRQGGPALLFERPTGHTMPVLGNLFGTVRRVCLAMGVDIAPIAIIIANEVNTDLVRTKGKVSKY